MTELELLPGLTVVIDESKFDIKSALRVTPDANMSEYTVAVDLTLTDILEKTESKVQGALVLRSK